MTKPPNNPNPKWAMGQSRRLMKMEKGAPTTPVTVTPLEMDVEGEEHWLETNHRVAKELTVRLDALGVPVSIMASELVGRATHIHLAAALLAIIEKQEARIKTLESGNRKD